MTTLQNLQSSRDAAVKNVFVTYARAQWHTLFESEDVNEVKKSFDKFCKDTKNLTLLVTAKIEDDVKHPTTFANIPIEIDENGKVTKRRQLYAVNFEALSFADVDKVTAYYIDNYLVYISASVAFKKEAKERAKREAERKEANEIKKKIENLNKQIASAVLSGDIEHAQELAQEVKNLSK